MRVADVGSMALLEPRRILVDEGVLGALRFGLTIGRTAPRRIREMRDVFDRYEAHLDAIAIVARKQ
jgi:hypothetical protein